MKWVATRIGKHADRPFTAARWSITASSRSTSTARSWRCARSACSSSAPISSARRWRPAPSRCASFRRPTTSRRMHIMSQGLFTNTSQSGPYRGAGRPEAAYFMERLIEHAARTIGMDPRRDPPPQSDPAEQAALHDADVLELRQRRVRAPDGQVHGDQRLEGLRRAQEGLREERQAARPRGELLHRVRRHLQRAHGPALRSRRHAQRLRRHAFARPGPRHRVRAARARMARRAVRTRSATSRATPPRSRSAAAPMPRAAPPSAAMRC